MDLISRKEATGLGLLRYFTGQPCRHGHVAERRVSNGNCTVCVRLAVRRYEAGPGHAKKVARDKRAKGPGGARRANFVRHIRASEKRNPLTKLRQKLRIRMREAIRGNAKVGSAVRDLGCTVAEFKAYIEALFQPGMTWGNWRKDGWHLDHIKPLAGFDLTDRDQFLEACHYTNMQPLWAKDNATKDCLLNRRL